MRIQQVVVPFDLYRTNDRIIVHDLLSDEGKSPVLGDPYELEACPNPVEIVHARVDGQVKRHSDVLWNVEALW